MVVTSGSPATPPGATGRYQCAMRATGRRTSSAVLPGRGLISRCLRRCPDRGGCCRVHSWDRSVRLYLKGLREWSFIGDDAYISFRYARNLIEGHGLVWNPGEYVEGYTNFSWVMWVAAGMWAGISPEVFSASPGSAAVPSCSAVSRECRRRSAAGATSPSGARRCWSCRVGASRPGRPRDLETMAYAACVLGALVSAAGARGATAISLALGAVAVRRCSPVPMRWCSLR